LFTISAAVREQRIDYGVLHTDAQDRLCGFEEKPVVPYRVSMGVYALNRRVLDFIPAGQPYGFDELSLRLLAEAEAVAVRNHAGYWLDIGRPDDYQTAIDDWPRLRDTLRL
jgi:NDP-sugar pyrophosphorylase family protein